MFIVWGGRLVLGGRDCIQCTYTYTTFAKSVTAEKKAMKVRGVPITNEEMEGRSIADDQRDPLPSLFLVL